MFSFLPQAVQTFQVPNAVLLQMSTAVRYPNRVNERPLFAPKRITVNVAASA